MSGEVLDEAKARWVLVGGMAAAYYDEPRATLDTDFIVETSKLKTVIARIRKAFPEGRIEGHEAVLRLKPYDIDFIKSAGHPLYAQAVQKRVRQKDRLYAPPLEIYLALKFLSMKSLTRDRERRMMDPADFAKIHRRNRRSLDRRRLLDHCSRAYDGARPEAEDLLDAIDHDPPIPI